MSILKENIKHITKYVNLHISKNISCSEIGYSYETHWKYNPNNDRLHFSILSMVNNEIVAEDLIFYLEGFNRYIKYVSCSSDRSIDLKFKDINTNITTNIIVDDLSYLKNIEYDIVFKFILNRNIILNYKKFEQKLEEKINNNQFEYLLLANENKLLSPELLNKWDYIINANKFDLL